MRLAVAMSGGVDSSVAAALLAEAGHEVIGLHMKLHAGDSACCGLDDVQDARRVAERMGFPFYVMNLEEAFQKAVVDDFVASWVAGATPNPCVHCNGVLKFDLLLRRALALGAERLATGHYARLREGRLFTALDPAKDQSYFLFPMREEARHRVDFPLGELSKAEVRAHAARLGLVTAAKPESMEVCFLPDHDHARFVAERADRDGAGEIVDEAGRVLGRHAGYWGFTVGQRRGLGLAGGPWFVLAVDPEARRVIVGPEGSLMSSLVHVRAFRWLRRPDAGEALQARVRHRGALVPCEVEAEEPFRLRLGTPARAVAPGQAVVVYAGEELLGGGWIRRAEG